MPAYVITTYSDGRSCSDMQLSLISLLLEQRVPSHWMNSLPVGFGDEDIMQSWILRSIKSRDYRCIPSRGIDAVYPSLRWI